MDSADKTAVGSDIFMLPDGTVIEGVSGREATDGELIDLFIDEVCNQIEIWLDEDRVPSAEGKLQWFAQSLLELIDGKGASSIFPKFVFKWGEDKKVNMAGNLAEKFELAWRQRRSR